MSHPTIEQTQADIDAAIASSATSDWLKAALRDGLVRDCVDVASDAEVLSNLLGRRCEALLQDAVYGPV